MPMIILSGPEYYRDRTLGLALIPVIAAWFVYRTAARRGERQRRHHLGWLALVLGPASGLVLWFVYLAVAEVSTLDWWSALWSFTVLGIVVGVIVATSFACSALLVRSSGKPAIDPIDDLP